MPASTGKNGLGVLLKVSDGAATPAFTTIGNVTTLSAGGKTLATVSATHLASPDFYEEFIPTLKTSSDWTFTIQWDPSDTQQNLLDTLLEDRETREFMVDTDAIGLSLSLEADCIVTELGNIEISPTDIMTRSVTLKPTGAARAVAN
jgi:Lambda phage tail tube protein, TTP